MFCRKTLRDCLCYRAYISHRAIYGCSVYRMSVACSYLIPEQPRLRVFRLVPVIASCPKVCQQNDKLVGDNTLAIIVKTTMTSAANLLADSQLWHGPLD